MPKKPNAKKADQAELDAFTEKYEILSSIYADPVEVLFDIMTRDEASLDLKAQVARDLMSFRFPKLKALEHKGLGDKSQPLVLNIQFAGQGQAKKPEIDVTPPVLKLAGSK